MITNCALIFSSERLRFVYKQKLFALEVLDGRNTGPSEVFLKEIAPDIAFKSGGEDEKCWNSGYRRFTVDFRMIRRRCYCEAGGFADDYDYDEDERKDNNLCWSIEAWTNSCVLSCGFVSDFMMNVKGGSISSCGRRLQIALIVYPLPQLVSVLDDELRGMIGVCPVWVCDLDRKQRLKIEPFHSRLLLF